MLVRIRLSNDGLSMHYRNIHTYFGAGLFCVLWAIGWTAALIGIARRNGIQLDAASLVFAAPFILPAFIVAGIAINLLLGRKSLELSGDGITYRAYALVPLRQTFIAWDEVKTAVANRVQLRHKGGPTNLNCVGIHTRGRPIHFAKGISLDEAAWLAEQINFIHEELAAGGGWAAATAAARGTEATRQSSGRRHKRKRGKAVVLRPGDEAPPGELAPPRPKQAALERQDDAQSITFSMRGKWNGREVAGATFFNLFWNGILGMGVVGQVQNFRWLPFLFVFPHLVIGAFIFAYWVIRITMPARQYRITLLPQSIESFRGVRGLARTKSAEIRPLDRLEIRPDDRDRQSAGNLRRFMVGVVGQGDSRLLLVDTENREVLGLDQLTRDDADWIGQTILRERAHWFADPDED
jgi:hypothetical protein